MLLLRRMASPRVAPRAAKRVHGGRGSHPAADFSRKPRGPGLQKIAKRPARRLTFGCRERGPNAGFSLSIADAPKAPFGFMPGRVEPLGKGSHVAKRELKGALLSS